MFFEIRGGAGTQILGVQKGKKIIIFELTQHPSRALNLDAYVASELQRNKDTVRCDELGAKVPGHRKEQLTQTLIVRLLKTHCFC